MNERDAAKELVALINEIQEAGHEVSLGNAGTDLWVGDVCLVEPKLSDQAWRLYR